MTLPPGMDALPDYGEVVHEMRGPRAVRLAVSEFLRADLLVRIPQLRTFWALSEAQLPLPVSDPGNERADGFVPREPDAIDRWPLVAVTSSRAVHRGRVDRTTSGHPTYQVVYPVRCWSWVRDLGHSATVDMRDDYATAIRSAVLSAFNLGTDGWLVVDERTVLTDFSDVVKVNGDRFVAGSFVGFDVHATETLTDRLAAPSAPARDTVATVNVGATTLPPAHPAL